MFGLLNHRSELVRSVTLDPEGVTRHSCDEILDALTTRTAVTTIAATTMTSLDSHPYKDF